MTKTKKKKVTIKKPFKQRLLHLFLQLTFLLTVAILLFFVSVRMGFYGKIPTVNELASIRNMEASEVYSADNKLIGKFYLQDRSAVSFNNISPNVLDALVATEDARFFSHSGIDYRSLLRVFVKTIVLQSRSGGGGSTITQQVLKNIYGRQQYKHFSVPITKLKEMMTASRLEKAYSKEEIITLYLNTVPFGDNAYGIESAAQRFFGKSAKNLSVPEAATLVGMLKANYTYNPRLFPDKSRSRRNVVINQMLKYEFINEEEAVQHKNALLDLNYTRISHNEGMATYFREQVRQRALKWCAANFKSDGAPYNLYTDGLKIYTTLDSRIQRYAESAMKKHMSALQKTFDAHIKGKEPWRNNKNLLEAAKRQSDRYRQMKNDGATDSEINKAFTTKTTMDLFSWQGIKEVQKSPLDSIKHYLSFLNTGFMALDPKTGEVKAWIGGINFKYFQYDHVNTTTKRQVGSTFKPIVYAAALEKGFDPCEYISSEQVTYKNFNNWTPSNSGGGYDMKYSMKGALTKSVNTVAVNLLDKTGIGKVTELASAMGIESELPEVPSLALGTANISLSELATVYATLVNNGTPIKPFTISRIKDANGSIVYESAFKIRENALSSATCEMVIDMMKNVVDSGTASRIRWKYNLSNDLIGKTGTTQNNTDGWFAAALPNLVMISWVGADNPAFRFRTTNLGQGANTALPITAIFLQKLNSDTELSDIANAKFRKLNEDLALKMECLPEMNDITFKEKLFGKKDEIVEKEFGDSLTSEKKSLRDRIKGLFRKKKD